MNRAIIKGYEQTHNFLLKTQTL